MAQLRYLNPEDLDPADRDVLVRPVNLYRAMANAPGIARAFLGLANEIRHRSRLDPRLREIAILRIAWLTRSAYEWSHHVKIGRDFGVTDSDVALAMDPATATGAEGAVLRAATGIAEGDGTLPEATLAGLRGHLAEDALTELLLIAALYVGLARFIRAAAIEVEPDYEPELHAFPLPAG
ncbi:carboxymuconolactone decarboxylase family protein [Falsiroseomonas bella]|uniref:Carboxymuconolactone decarboxylase family protein n=1 Tax=Falsiroseomonas bella TaxID=2184016 RepID=A0A317F5Y4_9PROT|nr:carboxymuconolactone decarboxylase family protein [Falsiroseomonas bella]PWS34590.1 carboxymuconolactone decarboxylase family protein [Falsiroseomonas bella]